MGYKNKEDQAAAARKHYEANKEKVKARAVEHRAKMRVIISALITETKKQPCADCGNTFPTVAMDFDHVRGEKVFNIGDSHIRGWSLKKVQDEIDKCEVVCSNCHRVRTWERLHQSL